VLAEDVAFDDARLSDLGYVVDAFGEDGITIVCFSVLCKETDKTLRGNLVM